MPPGNRSRHLKWRRMTSKYKTSVDILKYCPKIGEFTLRNIDHHNTVLTKSLVFDHIVKSRYCTGSLINNLISVSASISTMKDFFSCSKGTPTFDAVKIEWMLDADCGRELLI